MKTYIIFLLGFILSVSLNAAQQQRDEKKGKVVMPSNLFNAPQHNSQIIGEISKDDDITIYKRQRAWYNILTRQQLNGWVKMLNVKFIGSAKREGEIGVKDVFTSVISKNISPTASTGVRGFDEDDLKNAKADLKQLSLLLSFQTTALSAVDFAQKGHLKTVDVKLDANGVGDSK